MPPHFSVTNNYLRPLGFQAVRRNPNGTYISADYYDTNTVEQAIQRYKTDYLHDDANGTEILFIAPCGSIKALVRVQVPTPTPELVAVEIR